MASMLSRFRRQQHTSRKQLTTRKPRRRLLLDLLEDRLSPAANLLVTTTLVVVVAHTVVGLPWGVAFVLGAIVSPTDAVAASATAQRLGLSRRIVSVLEAA